MIETEQNLQMTESTVQSPVERGIMLAEKQYNEIVEQSEKAALLEQSFLSGLLDDTENSTVSPESRTQTTADPSSMTAQERLALLGETILDRGGMPTAEQLAAMGLDEPTARGIQSLVWLSKEGNPTARRAVEAMADLTDPQLRLEDKSSVNADYLLREDIPMRTDLKPQELVDELITSGQKFTLEDILVVTKDTDGMLLWLERGNKKSGLIHILERHAEDFTSQGIEDVPQLINDLLQIPPVKKGENSKGPYADYVFNGTTYRVAYGTNGYIVSVYPID